MTAKSFSTVASLYVLWKYQRRRKNRQSFRFHSFLCSIQYSNLEHSGSSGGGYWSSIYLYDITAKCLDCVGFLDVSGPTTRRKGLLPFADSWSSSGEEVQEVRPAPGAELPVLAGGAPGVRKTSTTPPCRGSNDHGRASE